MGFILFWLTGFFILCAYYYFCFLQTANRWAAKWHKALCYGGFKALYLRRQSWHEESQHTSNLYLLNAHFFIRMQFMTHRLTFYSPENAHVNHFHSVLFFLFSLQCIVISSLFGLCHRCFRLVALCFFTVFKFKTKIEHIIIKSKSLSALKWAAGQMINGIKMARTIVQKYKWTKGKTDRQREENV